MKDHDTSDTRSLEAANELLRRKLQADHGMLASISQLSPELENIWLNSVFNFEENLKSSKPVTLFNHLGCPRFARFDQLSPTDLSRELARLRGLMREKHVILDCEHEYDDATIYRFITQELFNSEMFFVPHSRMEFHFMYEEFHPWGT
jgi:hypothetical protein